MSAMRGTAVPDAGGPCAAFAARGWLVLRGVVGPSDLAALNRVFDDLMAPLDLGAAVIQRPRPGQAEPSLLRHLADGLAALACDLLGASSVQLLQDALLLKPAGRAGSIALHQDYSYTGYLDRPAGVAVGLALTDAGVESGCLHVVDGSHRWGLVGGLHLFAPELRPDLTASLTPEQRTRVAAATVALEVRAGDVTIHHCLTLHGSGGNIGPRPRKTVIAHLIDGSSRVVADRLPAGAASYFPLDAGGHLAAAAFPVLYRRDAAPDVEAAGARAS